MEETAKKRGYSIHSSISFNKYLPSVNYFIDLYLAQGFWGNEKQSKLCPHRY